MWTTPWAHQLSWQRGDENIVFSAFLSQCPTVDLEWIKLSYAPDSGYAVKLDIGCSQRRTCSSEASTSYSYTCASNCIIRTAASMPRRFEVKLRLRMPQLTAPFQWHARLRLFNSQATPVA